MQAVLLIGATGTGKSPLGDYLEEHGIVGKRCFHFDFGSNLRKAAVGGFDSGLFSDEDVQIVKNVLESGALLENETFYIAQRILRLFLAENGVAEGDMVILNGLPRHVGQAEAVDAIVDIMAVVYLDCTAEDVVARIDSNAGGDRTERTDDSMPEIRNKLEVFKKRTIPLLDHYDGKNVKILTTQVTLMTQPEDIAGLLNDFIS